jgi:TonB family protein
MNPSETFPDQAYSDSEKFCVLAPQATEGMARSVYETVTWHGGHWHSNCGLGGKAHQFCAESLLFSRRVLVAFDTGRGLVYAQASGWARVYLLWTFRNFRSLPQKVLNPRQQELITALYRTSSQTSPRQFDDALIGTVEGFIPPARVPAAQPVPGISSNNAAVRTMGRGRKVFNFGFAFDRFSFTQFDFSRFGSSGMTVKVGAGVLAAIVAVLGWRQSRSQPVLAHWASAAWTVRVEPAPQTAASQVSVDQVPMNQDASSEVAAAPIPTVPATEPVTSELPASAEASNRLDATPAIPHRANLFVTYASTLGTQTHQGPSHQALTPETPVESLRIQISGPPRKLVYPVCPVTNARGKVSLHAVVGSDGAVSQVKVVKGDRTLAAAAIEAVRQWRYQPSPAEAAGSERETNITVSFVSSEVVAVSFPDSAISR